MADANSTACNPAHLENLSPRLRRLSHSLDAEIADAIEEHTARIKPRLKQLNHSGSTRALAILLAARGAPPGLESHSMLTESCLEDALHLIGCRIALVADSIPLGEEEGLSPNAAEGIVQALREAEDAVQALILWQARCSDAFRLSLGGSR